MDSPRHIAPETEGHGRLGLAAVVAVLILAAALGAFKADASNPDLFWHLRAGQWIWEERAVPRTDMFSFSRLGREWIDAQWLFQLALYGCYWFFGATGFNLFTMLAAMGAAALLMAAPVDRLRWEWRGLAGVMVLLAIGPRLYPRPELFTFLNLAAMFFLLERARAGRLTLLVPVILVQLLFANSEGLWPIGVGLTWSYGLDAAFAEWRYGQRAEWRRLAPWAAAMAAVALVNLLQPYGWRGFTFPFVLLTEVLHPGTAHKNVIGEFAPVHANSSLLRMALPFLILAPVALASVFFRGKQPRPFLALLGLLLAGLGVSAVRNIGVGGVVLGGILMVQLPGWWARGAGRIERWTRAAGLAAVALAAVFSLLALTAPTRWWDSTYRKPGLGVYEKDFPAASVGLLKEIGYRGGIINPEWMGGYLIWSGWPEWKVLADSRMEVGGEQAILYCFKVYNSMDAMTAVAVTFDANAAVMSLRPPYTEVFRQMLSDRRWVLVQVDRGGGVFLRRDSGWDREIERLEIKDPLGYEFE